MRFDFTPRRLFAMGHLRLPRLWLVLGALLVRRVGTRHVGESRRILEASQRRAMSALHHGSVIVIVLTVLILWLPQLQHFAPSITAIAVALVVATKELLPCLPGSLLVRASSALVIGERHRHCPAQSSMPRAAAQASRSASQASGRASEGMRQSARGDRATLPTLGASAVQERLNCW